jgi:hypothetical protein
VKKFHFRSQLTSEIILPRALPVFLSCQKFFEFELSQPKAMMSKEFLSALLYASHPGSHQETGIPLKERHMVKSYTIKLLRINGRNSPTKRRLSSK